MNLSPSNTSGVLLFGPKLQIRFCPTETDNILAHITHLAAEFNWIY